MTQLRPLRLAVIAGEESGQLLAADCVDALAELHPAGVSLAGVGGRRLETLGLESLFDPGEIALTGISAVAAKLPRLLWLIRQTADRIVAFDPDCVLLVDSPDFSLRVARRIKRLAPRIPVVKYVAPSVWAWRPGRAPAMRALVDHVLAVLPFEPEAMRRLGGPPTTYVGHRAATDPFFREVRERRMRLPADVEPVLLLLPGSRRGEVNRLLPPFGETLGVLAERGLMPRVVIPTVPHVAALVERQVATWASPPTIICEDEAGRLDAFARARVALAASGTVTLELAMADIPAVSCYILDPLMRQLTGMISAWTAALPNLIADEPVIPEYFNEQVRPGMLARRIEQLSRDGPARQAQLDGYAKVRSKMAVAEPPSRMAATIIHGLAARHMTGPAPPPAEA